MVNLEKYKGVIPAFYACYDAEGNVSPERVRALTEYHIRKGVKGVYERIFRRVHLPEPGRPQDYTGECNGGCQGQADGYRTCGLQ